MHPGTLFADRYRLTAELGRGDMGVVHRAYDERLDRPVALKVMSEALRSSPDFRRRFAREASTMAQLSHPNIVQVYDYEDGPHGAFVVMRLIPGHNLRDHLLEGPLSLRRTANVISGAAAGLDAAHRAHHLHHDVQPANILLEELEDGTERALLADLGLRTGSPAYLAPEQLRGERGTVRSDVFSLACVAFECLTGFPAYVGGTAAEVYAAHRREPQPDVRRWRPDLSPAVARALTDAMAFDPEQRTGTAGELAAELSRAAHGERSPAVAGRDDEGLVSELFRGGGEPFEERSPHRVLVTLGAFVLVGALALVGVVVATSQSDDSSASAGATTSPTGPPPTVLSPAQTELIARLPSSLLTGCTGQPTAGPQKAALTCNSVLPGANEVLVKQWNSPADMAADWKSQYLDAPADKKEKKSCESWTVDAKPRVSTWTFDKISAPLTCYVNTNGHVVMMWEYPSLSLQVVGISTERNYAALRTWWLGARPLIT